MNEFATRKIEQARRLAGEPVCVVLNDGTYYIGRIQGVQNGQLLLAGAKGQGRMRAPASRKGKAKVKVSGLFPALGGGLLGGGAGAAGAAAGGGLLGGLGGLAGFMSFMSRAMPIIQMGMGVVKSIMPLMNLFNKK